MKDKVTLQLDMSECRLLNSILNEYVEMSATLAQTEDEMDAIAKSIFINSNIAMAFEEKFVTPQKQPLLDDKAVEYIIINPLKIKNLK